MSGSSPEEESKLAERYKFIVSYNGTEFCGFQIQGQTRTIQLELETALRKLGWKEDSIIGAGRTDSGVHAAGQVFSAALPWKHGTDALLKAMNANLPEDISIRSVERVSDDFHARFDAVSRCYHYHVYGSETRDPLRDPFAWRLPVLPDPETLNRIASLFIGIHDFRAFGSPPRKDRGTIRNVMESHWYKAGEDELYYEVRANAFLYHMVRRLVFIQVCAAQGFISDAEVAMAVDQGYDAKPGLAPPNGLRLWNVTYKETDIETKE